MLLPRAESTGGDARCRCGRSPRPGPARSGPPNSGSGERGEEAGLAQGRAAAVLTCCRTAQTAAAECWGPRRHRPRQQSFCCLAPQLGFPAPILRQWSGWSRLADDRRTHDVDSSRGDSAGAVLSPTDRSPLLRQRFARQDPASTDRSVAAAAGDASRRRSEQAIPQRYRRNCHTPDG